MFIKQLKFYLILKTKYRERAKESAGCFKHEHYKSKNQNAMTDCFWV